MSKNTLPQICLAEKEGKKKKESRRLIYDENRRHIGANQITFKYVNSRLKVIHIKPAYDSVHCPIFSIVLRLLYLVWKGGKFAKV